MSNCEEILCNDKLIRVSAHQPNFIPWAGFWNKLVNSDIFVITAGLQYVRRSYSNRVIMSDNNSWATVPVKSAFIPYNKIKISDIEKVKQIGKRILHWSNQKKYLYRDRIIPVIKILSNINHTSLTKLNIDIIKEVLKILKHNKTQLIINNENWENKTKLELVSSLLQQYGNVFMSGGSAKEYLGSENIENFRKSILFQQLNYKVRNETILHLIASEEKPLECIFELAKWKKLV